MLASDVSAGDWFGSSISISGSNAIVGALQEDGGHGSPFSNAGAAYVFDMSSLGIFLAEAPVPGSLSLATNGQIQ